MITKTESALPDHVHIIFELPSCIWADQIYVTGEFNHWDSRSMPMQQSRNGIWCMELDLPCSRVYEFRYVVDGHWVTDCHTDGVVANPYGTQNSIVDTARTIPLLQSNEEGKPPAPLWWQKKS